jgi:hypothetical protein
MTRGKRLAGWSLAAAMMAASGAVHAHAGADHPAPPTAPGKRAALGKDGKAEAVRAVAARPAASAGQQFCMKNREGKLHCIPFGPAH